MRVLFMGRKQVARECLQVLSRTPGIAVIGILTDSHLAHSPTAALARELRLPLFDYETACTAIDRGELTFDLGLSMLYWRKIKPPMLGHARRGIVNFHPAPLPEYKGVGGYNLAILEGLQSWAATAHYVDERIDTGGIIAQEPVAINAATDTVVTLERRTNKGLLRLFERVLGQICKTDRSLPVTPNIGGRYLSRDELEAMKRIDLARDDVDRKIRAFWFPPYDGAYIEIGRQKYTLVDRSILSSLADPAASSLFTAPAPPHSKR